MQITLSKPIAPGYRRSFEVQTDEPVDAQGGAFFVAENVTGDSSPPTLTDQTNKSLKGWINGDGTLENKVVRIRADGHIGDGDAPIVLDISYSVAHKDATDFVNFKEGTADEPMPGITPPPQPPA